MKAIKTAWRRGERARLATFAGITPSFLCDILHRRKTPSADVAVKLAGACVSLNIPIRLTDWCQPRETTSALFDGAPL